MIASFIVTTYFVAFGVYAHATGANPFGYLDITTAAWWGFILGELLRRRGWL